MHYSIVICEDNPIDIECLKISLKKYWKQEEQIQISIYSDGEDYKKNYKTEKEPDILLLDFEMKKVNGISLKEFLEQKKSKTKIVFISNHMEIMQEAFGANVYGFLRKPIEENKLFFYLDKICRDIYQEQAKVFLNNTGKKVLKTFEILWIKAEGRYSKIKQIDDVIFSDRSLSDWEKELDNFFFFRAHKSYIVNFQQIAKITEYVIFTTGDKIPIARRKKKNLKEAYKKFLIWCTL